MRILVINGPNLNMLGSREPDIYGNYSLTEIIDYTNEKLKNLNFDISWYQSNHEGEIIDKLQEMLTSSFDALVINPAGYSHSSVAILDALKMVKLPKIEVHLSNTHAREEFRKKRITAGAVDFILEGLGRDTYTFAVQILNQRRSAK